MRGTRLDATMFLTSISSLGILGTVGLMKLDEDVNLCEEEGDCPQRRERAEEKQENENTPLE